MKIKATYHTEWDYETLISSSCIYDTETNDVTDIETVDVDGYDIDCVTREYIELPDGTEIDLEDFTIDGLYSDENDEYDELSDEELDELREKNLQESRERIKAEKS